MTAPRSKKAFPPVFSAYNTAGPNWMIRPGRCRTSVFRDERDVRSIQAIPSGEARAFRPGQATPRATEGRRPAPEDDMHECARGLWRATSLDSGVDLLLEAARILGLPIPSMLDDISQADAPMDTHGQLLAERFGWSTAFIDRWVARAYSLCNPVAILCRFEHLPFVWMSQDTPDYAVGDRETHVRTLQELAAQGVTASIIVPVRTPRGRIGYIGFGGQRSREEVDRLLEVHAADLLTMGHAFLRLYLEAHGATRVPEDCASLSPREVDCLTHAAQGHGDEDIANRLGISKHTARFHIDNAIHKLGATNRTHAVALAAQLGLVGAVT
jgi:DNA-binding CsgD family transcriptional regulator